MQPATSNQPTATNKGWAKLPPYQVFHFYHAPQRGDTVQRAACNVPSLRAIPANCFADEASLPTEQRCPKCSEFLANVNALVRGLADQVTHGPRRSRFMTTAASLALCLLLLGCHQAPAPKPAKTTPPRNLTTPTPKPICYRDLPEKWLELIDKGLTHQLSPAAQQIIDNARACPTPTASLRVLGGEAPSAPPPGGGLE